MFCWVREVWAGELDAFGGAGEVAREFGNGRENWRYIEK